MDLEGQCKVHKLWVSSSTQSCVVEFTLTSDDAQPVLVLGTSNPNQFNLTNLDARKGAITLTGDFTGYKGTFSLSPYCPVIYTRAGLLGDPRVSNASAVRLEENAAIAFDGEFEQDPSRGFEIAGSRSYVMAWDTLANSYTVKYPICGTGKLCKRGPGTVTLDGNYTASGGIEVQEGTLVLGALGSFPAGLSVVVSDGATLVQHKQIPGISVTGAGNWIQDIQNVVPFSNVTAIPLDFTDAEPTLPLSLKLSEQISIESFAPDFEAKELEVARLPSGSTATAEDFIDATEKTCGLPRTSFRIESRSGYKAVVLVVRPVVWSIADFNNSTYGLNGTAANWANGASASSGYDYFMTNIVYNTGSAYTAVPIRFNGGSLTLKDCGLYLTSPALDVGDLSFYGNVITRYNSTAVTTYLGYTDGSVRIAEGAHVDLLTIRVSNGYVEPGRIAIDISGEGSLTVSMASKIDGGAPIYLTGDNSAFSGKLKVTNPGTITSVADATTLHLGTATSFGGAMTVATADGVTLEKYSLLYPEQTMTLASPNRGITIISGGFNVTNGVALTVSVPLVVAGPAVKRGGGELALGGGTTFSDGSLAVTEGSVRALSDDSVAGDFTFSDGTTIVLDPTAGLTSGFSGSFAIEPGGRVNVELDSTSLTNGDSMVSIPICTVAAGGADLTERFVLNRVRRYVAKVVSEEVTVGETPCVRYSAVYCRAGLVISIR